MLWLAGDGVIWWPGNRFGYASLNDESIAKVALVRGIGF